MKMEKDRAKLDQERMLIPTAAWSQRLRKPMMCLLNARQDNHQSQSLVLQTGLTSVAVQTRLAEVWCAVAETVDRRAWLC